VVKAGKGLKVRDGCFDGVSARLPPSEDASSSRLSAGRGVPLSRGGRRSNTSVGARSRRDSLPGASANEVMDNKRGMTSMTNSAKKYEGPNV
jgi:hypothetical protein